MISRSKRPVQSSGLLELVSAVDDQLPSSRTGTARESDCAAANAAKPGIAIAKTALLVESIVCSKVFVRVLETNRVKRIRFGTG
jgi:hypothetical protein